MNVDLLRSSFERLAPQADQLAACFYTALFTTYPQYRPLFVNTEPAAQRKKLMASVAAVVAAADRPEQLAPVLKAMGERHDEYGVLAHMYPAVSHTLLATLGQAAGEAWTPEVADTWDAALRMVSECMIEAQGAVA
jgi:hemoglobin-like flavoprotein